MGTLLILIERLFLLLVSPRRALQVMNSFKKIKTGKLTGLLFEQAVGSVGKFIAQSKAQDLLGYCSSTLTTWLSKGYTTTFDAGIRTGGSMDVTLLSVLPNTPM